MFEAHMSQHRLVQDNRQSLVLAPGEECETPVPAPAPAPAPSPTTTTCENGYPTGHTMSLYDGPSDTCESISMYTG